MGTNVRMALMITRREIGDQIRDWRIVFPLILLTLVFPGIMNFAARQVMTLAGQSGMPLLSERLIPFLLLVVGFFPVSISLVMALESFVGEKERRSLEPLLTSPLTDSQLYLGKLLAALILPLLASYLGIGVYLFGVYRQVGWTPDPTLLVQILLLSSVQGALMVSGAVVISAQTTSARAANLLASFIILPMALLIQGESLIMFWGKYEVLWLVILGQAVVAGLLMRTGVAHFNREELLGREMDRVDFAWSWRVFRRAFVGQAHSPLGWYRSEMPQTLRRLALPGLFMFVALMIGMAAGATQASVFRLPPELIGGRNLGSGLIASLDSMNFISADGVGLVWLHNLRAILIATLLGVFTFGVLGVVALMLPMMLIGYLIGSAALAGVSPLLFLTALVLPHGLLEIPAMSLVGAAILGLGATLAAPASGSSVSEAWLSSLADWARVVFGLAVPMFFGAALIEVFVTPHIAAALLGSGL